MGLTLLALLGAVVAFVLIVAVGVVGGLSMMGAFYVLINAVVEIYTARDRAWQRVADELGGAYEGGLYRRSLGGQEGPFPFVLETVRVSKERTVTRMRVSGLPGALTVQPRALLSTAGLGTEDPRFDVHFQVEGGVAALARLDEPTRAALLALREATTLFGTSRVTVSGGALEVEHPVPLHGGEALSRFARSVLDAARRVGPDGGEDLDRWVHVARTDSVPAVRRRALERLVELSPPHAREAARSMRDDPDPVTRVVAAGALGDTSLLGAIALDASATPRLRARAVAAFASHPGSVDAIVEPGLGDPVLQVPVVQLLGAIRSAAYLPALLGLLDGPLADLGGHDWDEERPLAMALADALHRIGDVRAEDALIVLARGPSVELRIAACEALGELGTVRAVAPLLAYERGELGRAARQAIAAIHARVDGAAPGQLSLARVQGGELSRAEAPSRPTGVPTKG